ncbi:30S ribosomal protein [Actinidia chinensis var. chinensis]|uniref:Small ribosomal subunit protein uS15c n=1 Tax=Actinidia chinensis var. chinensis TaxID=1590841 RepID=A0A2R6QFY5_ACTCC|nr:30S ribosomal protein [Actinidia chinensis var. chinensis]
MAATAVALQLRTKHRAIRNPSAIHFFSYSSTSDSNAENQNTTSSSSSSSSSSPPSQSQTSISSYFSDVKASLKKQAPSQQRQPPKPFYPSSAQTPTSKVASLEEIRKNLSEFRRRSAVPPPEGKPLSQHISLEELYKRNVMSKAEDFANEAGKGGRLSFEAIRESLSQLRSNATKNQVVNNNPMSLSKFKESFKLGPVDLNARDSRVVIGGTERVPASVFEKEKRGAESPAMKTEFVKMYNYKELGTKLRKLRPEAKGENWFLLEELNERLMKLREMEVKETESRIVGDSFKDLRDSLIKLQISDNEKTKKQTIQRLDILGHIGGTPNFMLAPPKEHLVEMYFHPDNMSSSEKLKLELQKVRDEFKMSESDCGSSRVQVAQLTTKIKHLSTALHKKDKHSRKGLQGMVQRRKKLLKYLRRTDWDSYCLVLSKLGLRDNPDYKN